MWPVAWNSIKNKAINYFKNFNALLIGVCVALVIFEIFLRIYNPFGGRLKGDKIILPINQHYEYDNSNQDKLSTKVVHTKNALGFRGDNPPANFDNYTSIITVGGSTTECLYINDKKDWPELLGDSLSKSGYNIWLNNAGLDGHSTYGHLILLKDHILKLKPQYLIFLVGINDVGRGDVTDNESDMRNIGGQYYSWKDFLIKNTELFSTIYNVKRAIVAKKAGLIHHRDLEFTKLGHIPFDSIYYKTEVKRNIPLLKEYRNRLQEIIDLCKKNNIKPVFLSQSALYGEGVDPSTGINLETVEIYDNINGKFHWELLKEYNQATKDVCLKNEVYFIDLAVMFPKDSKYYYDFIHYSNSGCQKISELIYPEMKAILSKENRALVSNK